MEYMASCVWKTSLINNMTGFAKRVLYTYPIVRLLCGITLFISKLLSWKFLSYKCNDGKVLLPNFKAVGLTQAELYSLKFEKLDVCIRPFFANLVTNNVSFKYWPFIYWYEAIGTTNPFKQPKHALELKLSNFKNL